MYKLLFAQDAFHYEISRNLGDICNLIILSNRG